MRMIAEYLERVHQFERMATRTVDPALKAQFLEQAAAYRRLAEERAARLGLPMALSDIPPPQ